MSPTVPPISVITKSTAWRLGDDQDPLLDLVGDVRDHLDGGAEVVAAALAADDRVVDGAGGDVGGARGVVVGEALVVAEIEIGLGAVLGDEHLAVLERAHRPRVDVDVGVELLDLDPEAAGDQQAADRGRGDPLAQRGDDAAGDEDEARFARLHRFRSPRLTLPSESIQRSGGIESIVFEIDRNSPKIVSADDQRERDPAPRVAERDQHRHPGERPDEVRAGVAEHRPLAQGERTATTATGPMNSPSSSSGSTVQAPRQRPASSSDERLLDPARPQVEQVEEVGGQQQQREVGDVVDALAAEARGRVGGQRAAPRPP